jgi:peptidoglycan/xylan/chitin deacetylase (PgdA/CDA1 family)
VPIARLVLWLSTFAALALVVRLAFFEPLPGYWAFALLVWITALVFWGVLNPRLEMFADVLWCAPEGCHGVAFTFDDGPDPETTPQVLAILKEHNALATFFVIGKKAEQHPDLVRAITDAGHSLGIHSYDHEYSYAFKSVRRVSEDILRCQEILRVQSGRTVTLFRPPIGQISPRTASGAKRAQVRLVGWSVRGRDGLRGATAEQIVERVGQGLRDGAVILLHDAAERGDRTPASVEALPRLLKQAEQLGLQCVTLESWS